MDLDQMDVGEMITMPHISEEETKPIVTNAPRLTVRRVGTAKRAATTSRDHPDPKLGCSEEFVQAPDDEPVPGMNDYVKLRAIQRNTKTTNRIKNDLETEDVKLVNELGRLAPDQLMVYIKNLHNSALSLGKEERKQLKRGKMLRIFPYDEELNKMLSEMNQCSTLMVTTDPRKPPLNRVLSVSGRCVCVSELLRRVEHLRREAQADDGEFSLVQNMELRWAKLFMEFILGSAYCQATTCSALGDDMIWYVPMQRVTTSFHLSAPPQLQVFRRQSKKQPAPCDSTVNWEETVCLNLILQQLDFFVTCAVCTKTSPQNLQIIRKNCQKVYPSPSRRRMDSKGEGEEITYPKIYFAIDGFEDVFNDIVVRDGECVCVELVVRDRQRAREAVTFLGSIRYEVLKQVYDAKASSSWGWAQRLVKDDKRRKEFVRMRGPRGKGYAEMAVARVPGCGTETPQTERSHIDFPDLTQFESALGRRRMSEQNLAGAMIGPSGGRVAMTPSGLGTLPRGRRWQSEADTAGQYPEVEASSIDDELEEGVLSRLWSVRGFGQAWHWLREKKRAECTPLNAYLTLYQIPNRSHLAQYLTPCSTLSMKRHLGILLLYLQCVVASNNGGWITDEKDIIGKDGPCNIERYDADDLSQAEFLKRFAYSEPIIIYNIDNEEFKLRTERERMLQEWGEMDIVLNSANTYSYTRVPSSFKEYLEHKLKPQNLETLGNETLYLFGDIDQKAWKPLLDAYKMPEYTLPGHQPALSFGLAGAGTGVPFHFHGPGFAEVIHGSKRWFLYEYEDRPEFDPDRTTFEWYLKDYPNLPREKKPLECLLKPGEVIYFPDKWWHATLNCETSVFISTFLSP
ncbi:unnamed protein product, partial [Mesorhabditis spiculigera]